MADQQVRFTEQFFDRLDLLLPSERGEDGTPSVTDDPDVRVCIGTGVLVGGFAVFAVREGTSIEAFWMTIDSAIHDVG